MFIDTDLDSNFTHDYFEYEQGQANIIVKGRHNTHFNFWKGI